MELSIAGDGPDATREITDLAEWLHESRLGEVQSVEQQKQAPKPGEQGPEALDVLWVVLSAPAVIALVGCIRAYIEARRPTMTITVTTPQGTVKIDARNPPSIAELGALGNTLSPKPPPQPD